ACSVVTQVQPFQVVSHLVPAVERLVGAWTSTVVIAIVGTEALLPNWASAGSIAPKSTAVVMLSRTAMRRMLVMVGSSPRCVQWSGAGGLLGQPVPELGVEVDLVQVVGVVDRLEVLGRPGGPAQAGQQPRHAFLVEDDAGHAASSASCSSSSSAGRQMARISQPASSAGAP